jgi:hypothetical protein
MPEHDASFLSDRDRLSGRNIDAVDPTARVVVTIMFSVEHLE